jgi:AcrR family transcriptional regulator
VPRTYRSPKREKGRETTRRQVLAAAGALFRAQGYPQTTIAAIAQAARVANETVYAVFRSKPELLRQVAHHEVLGEASGVVTADWLQRIQGEQSQRRRWEMMRTATARVLERSRPIHSVIVQAADVDPKIASLWQELEATRRRDVDTLMTLLEEVGSLRRSHREAVDVTWALSRSTGLFAALRVDCGWSAARAAGAVSDAVERAILD